MEMTIVACDQDDWIIAKKGGKGCWRRDGGMVTLNLRPDEWFDYSRFRWRKGLFVPEEFL